MALIRKIETVYTHYCLYCGKEFKSPYKTRKYCHSSCRTKSFFRKQKDIEYSMTDAPPKSFTDSMVSYNNEDMVKAYHAFLNWRPLLKVVDCHCRGEFMCYPHQLEHYRAIYYHGQKVS